MVIFMLYHAKCCDIDLWHVGGGHMLLCTYIIITVVHAALLLRWLAAVLTHACTAVSLYVTLLPLLHTPAMPRTRCRGTW